MSYRYRSLENKVLTEVEQQQCLRQALAKLPSNYERMIVILYLLGFSQVEIAGVCGVTKQEIQQKIRRFKRLAKKLNE